MIMSPPEGRAAPNGIPPPSLDLPVSVDNTFVLGVYGHSTVP